MTEQNEFDERGQEVTDWLRREARRFGSPPDELVDRVVAIPVSEPPARWGWLGLARLSAFAGATVAVVLAVIVTAFGLGLLRPAPATPPGETRTPSASPDARPSPRGSSTPAELASPSQPPQTPSPAAGPEWPAVLLPNPAPGYRGALPADLARGGDLLVAVGGVGPCCTGPSPESHYEAFVWISADGVVWEALEEPTVWGGRQLGSVAWNGSEFLAGGGRVALEALEPGSQLIPPSTEFWRSVNGRDWVLIPHTGALFGIRDLVAAPQGWVAVGVTGQGPADPSGQATVSVSTDGRVWTTTTLDASGSLDSVVSLADGTLLTSGLEPVTTPDPEQLSTTRLWASTDALTWQPVAELEGYVNALSASDDGQIVAVGRVDETPSAWLSSDGRTWRRVAIAPQASGNADTVMIDGDRIVAGGSILGTEGMQVPALWSSSDRGGTWAAMSLERPDGGVSGSVQMLTMTERGVVGLGDFFIEGAVPIAWIEPE